MTAAEAKSEIDPEALTPTDGSTEDQAWKPDECPVLAKLAAGEMLLALRTEPRSILGSALVALLRGDRMVADQELERATADAAGNWARLQACAQVADVSGHRKIAVDARAEALAALRRMQSGSGSDEAEIQLARAQMRVGQLDDAMARARSLAGRARSPNRVFELLRELGLHEDARAVAREKKIHDALLARLALDCGEYDTATAIARSADVPVIGAAAAMLSGNLDDAESLLNAADDSREARVWRAELLFRRGQLEEAEVAARRVHAQFRNVRASIIRLIAAASLHEHRGPGPSWSEVAHSFDLLRSRAFEPVMGREDSEALLESRTAAVRLLRQLLESMAGSWGGQPTHILAGQLLPLEIGLSTRTQSSLLLKEFQRTRDIAATRSAFFELQRAYPWSPFPLTYFGEFLLWLGETSEARQAFGRALRLDTRTRWAFAGLSLVALRNGHPLLGWLISRVGIMRCGRLPESTVTGVDGEAAFKVGLHRVAEPLLRRATSDRPGRHGARALLSSLLLRRGEVEAATEEWHTLRNLAPGLSFDLPEIPSSPAIDLFVERLGGNRSSWFASGIVNGEFKVLTPTKDVQRAATAVLRAFSNYRRSVMAQSEKPALP